MIRWQDEGVSKRVRGAWRLLFEGKGSQVDADIAWMDLSHLCYENRSTYVPDDPHGREMLRNEAKREILLRLRVVMQVSEAESREMVERGQRSLGRGVK
jgi:hypothetical protein